jgi:exonuclease III
MRIVSWNCSMAFYKKRHLIEALLPDVAIIQEVAKKDIVNTEFPFGAWAGSNPNKGLGVIGFRPASYKITETADPALPWHIPFSVHGLNIVALWAHQASRELRYVRVTHEIVDRHADYLAGGRGLIVGDFNSNTIWDREHPGRNHSMLVDKLGGLGLDSVFHRQEQTAHGNELVKTYFHTKNLQFGHHIDYAFLSSDVEAKVSVGEPEAWLTHSDHMPLIVDIG